MSGTFWFMSLCVGMLFWAATETHAEEPVIENGNFEQAGPDGEVAGWQLCVIGPAPRIGLDDAHAKQGVHSLCIAAEAATDAALQQHVPVEPGAYYTFEGWVSTQGLTPAASSDVHGTLAVMTPGGAGEGRRIAVGESHAGDTDWTKVSVSFKAPSDARVRLLCFFCGWGRGTGTAWFDGLTLRRADMGPAQVKVLPKEITDLPISPLIYGNFIESGFGRQVDGMWSELLFDRSFEGPKPYKWPTWGWLRRKHEDDLTKEDWWHSGYEECPWYVDAGNPEARVEYPRHFGFHHGLQSGHVVNDSKEKKAFLCQDGVYLHSGTTYLFGGDVRAGATGSSRQKTTELTVGLYKEGELSSLIVEDTVREAGSEWQRVSVNLPNQDYTGRATLAVSVPPGQRVTFDAFSLIPENTVDGWRPEVVEALRCVRPRILRWPGGCFASFYNWRDGIGPAAERRPRESEYWGGIEYNDVGTVEFLRLCQEIEAEPFICANVMTGTPAEAADWVAYCNAGTEHPMGALRASHGHPEPFGVTYWELDNETYRKLGPLEYAHECVRFADSMKTVDPSIKLVMVGYWRFHDHLEEMLDIAGEYVDLVTDRALDEAYLRRVLAILDDYNGRSERDIRLCNTEWLAPRGDVPVIPDALNRQPSDSEMTLQNQQIRWQYAMNAARQLLVFQRLGGRFVFANFNNLANTWGQNVIECPKEGCYVSAAGRMFELMSRCPAAWVLALEEQTPNAGMTLQAAWDEAREALVLMALNNRNAPSQVTWDLSALSFTPRAADIEWVDAPSPASHNSLNAPDTVQRHSEERSLEPKDVFECEAPPHSVMVVVLRP